MIFALVSIFIFFVVSFAINIFALTSIKKFFGLKSPTHRKATELIFISGVVSIIVTLVATYLKLTSLAFFIVLLILFVVFHAVLFYQYKSTWKKSLGVYIVFSLVTIAISALTIIPFRKYVFEPYLVSGESMQPLYQKGDTVLVSKWSITFPRGEVVIYRDKEKGNHYIGRVVGLPGELVELRVGELRINNKKIVEDYVVVSAQETFAARLKAGEYFILPDVRTKPIDFKRYGRIGVSQLVGGVYLNIHGLLKVE